MSVDMRHLRLEDVLTQVEQQGGLERACRIHRATHLTNKVNNLSAPWRGYIPPVGTWRCDPEWGQFDILIEIPVEELHQSEPDAAHWYGFTQYVEWARAGIIPPPPRVVRHIKGHLITLDNRRVLAAKEVGTETLLCWLSETAPDGHPLWELPRTRTWAVIWPDGVQIEKPKTGRFCALPWWNADVA